MSAEVAQNGDAQFAAVDPTDLEEGDTVIVSDVAEDGETRGTVEGTKNEWGRYGVELTREDGVTVMVWEETGRTFTKVESEEENATEKLAETLAQAFEAASRAVEEASPLERAARKGERDAYQSALGNIENYGDLEWAHEVCRDREASYRLKSIDSEDTSPHMVRKYNAQFQTYARIANRIEQVAEIED